MNIVNTKQLDRMPISDVDLEKGILYQLLHKPAIQHRIYKLDANDFYNIDNKHIFGEFLKIIQAGEKLDPLTVPVELKRNKQFLSILNHTTVTDFEAMLKKLKDYSDLRKIQYLSYKATVMAHENQPPAKIKNWLFEKVKAIRGLFDIDFKKQTDQIDAEFANMIDEPELIAVKTGYSRLDRIVNGFWKSSFNVIAAAQGMGKSSFVLNLVHHICSKQKKNVLYVSLEMDYTELHAKLVSMVSGVNFSDIIFNSHRLTDNQLRQITNARAAISEYGLYRIGENEHTPADIEAVLTELKNIDVVFIDYFQLMSPNINSPKLYDKMTALSRELKSLARRSHIPIVAISSISRKYADRPDKRPHISDLRETGQLEYDAGMVLLLHRESEFREANINEGEDPETFDKQAEVIVAKNRFGPSNKMIDFYFDGATGRFNEMEVK